MRLPTFFLAVLVLVLSLLAGSARADTTDIGTAAPFAVLGEAGVSNTGSSEIYGSVAGSTGTPTITGFPSPGSVNPPGVLYLAGVSTPYPDAPFTDATAAYNYAAGLIVTTAEGTTGLGSGGAGGSSSTALTPGVYSFGTASTSPVVYLNGTLYLNAGGSADANWTFLIPAALTTGSSSDVVVEDAGAAGTPFTGSITWDVYSSATLGSSTTFLGTIISNAGDTLGGSATIGCGRVISLGAAVSLDDNTIGTPADCTVTDTGTIASVSVPAPTPEPGTFALFLSGLLAVGLLTFRKSRVSSLSC
jgi:ice-binding like protein/PEP-CTERM motif-containing protein